MTVHDKSYQVSLDGYGDLRGWVRGVTWQFEKRLRETFRDALHRHTGDRYDTEFAALKEREREIVSELTEKCRVTVMLLDGRRLKVKFGPSPELKYRYGKVLGYVTLEADIA